MLGFICTVLYLSIDFYDFKEVLPVFSSLKMNKLSSLCCLANLDVMPLRARGGTCTTYSKLGQITGP